MVDLHRAEREQPARSRVLIVDDDERNLLALQTVVEDVAEVVMASSGEEALRRLLKYDFAAILLDVFMPDMDGYETAQLIRRRELSKRIPIIFLSAVNKEEAHLRRGYAMGAVDYVFKPVDPLILRSKVAVFVDLHEKNREIQRKAQAERRLRDENLRVQHEMLLAEQALRRAEQRQAVVLKSLPLVLYLEPVENMPCVPSYVSGDLKALTGFDFEEVKANPSLWSDRIHPDDRARVVAARTAVAQTGSLSIDYRWHAADGSYRHLLERAVVLRDEAEDRAVEVAGTLLDITNQRQLEQQLAHAHKMDAVGKLTGGIAHDFNNLLAAVLGGLTLIEKRIALDAEQQKLVDLTRRSAEQGADLVKRLLSFARAQTLQTASVPCERLVDSLKELLEHTLGGLVEVHWVYADRLPPVLADENQLGLALMNLIINARDAMPAGGVITVTIEQRTASSGDPVAPGDYVVFSVADTGIGMDPELVERVFEPFFTTKDVGKGTGLGLSMVYGFAQQSGGAVNVHSVKGEGTCFTLWLPRAVSPAPADKGTVENLRRAAPAQRILLVDDHAAVRATTEGMLRELGHETIGVASAQEGLALLERGEVAIDLLVSDYAMPAMSGAELIRAARAQREDLPAVVVTGYIDASAIEGRLDRVALLSKPFTAAELNAALAEALASAKVEHPRLTMVKVR